MGYYLVLGTDGRFWGGWGWTRDLGRAKLWAGAEAEADAGLAASCLRRLGHACEVEFLSGLGLKALASLPALAA